MTLAPEKDYGTPPVATTETVTVTIDGHDVTVPAGTSVLRAATEAGVEIPKLCATDSLKAFGSCRMCLVEIDGARGVPASCTTPCSDGMVVATGTDEVRRLRRQVMELYLSDHPEDCDGCASGNCEMQALARTVDAAEVRYGRPHTREQVAHPAPVDLSNPYFGFDPSTCIVWARLADQRRRHGVPLVRVRVLRRLRAGVPDLGAPGALRGPAGDAHPVRGDHLRLLRRRLLLPGRGQRRG
jgi:formate dehydrogenase major subunit